MSVIDISRRLVHERHKKDIDPDTLVPDDPKVFNTIKNGRTQGLFQIEGQGITKVFTGLNDVDFESLIAGVSLYRPGPMQYIPDYQARANKLQEVKYFHEDVKEILESTFGILVYQEQLMKLSQRLAGYTAGEADMLRKATGKKSQAVMDKVLPELRQRTIENGYEPRIADQLVKLIEPFVGYGFNRSHGAAYAYVAYQTAYFKTYYPTEFYTSLLTIFSDKNDKVIRYITEAKESGIDILPPDVNKSETQFIIDDEHEKSTIRYGFDAIKSFGAVAQKALLDERNANGPFHDLEDLLARVPKKSLNKTSLRALSLSGALDSIHPSENRMEIFQLICILRGFKDDLTAEIQAFNKKAMLEKEKEYLGAYLSGHPLDGIGVPVDWEDIPDDDTIITTGVIVRKKEVLTSKRQEPMAFLTIDFLEGPRDLVIFPREYADVRSLLREDLVVKVRCHYKYNPMRDERGIIIDRLDIPKRINRHILQK